MKFDEKKLFTCLNKDKVKVGSKGFFSDNLGRLKASSPDEHGIKTLYLVEGEELPFFSGDNWFQFFYLVEDTEGAKNGN